MKLTFCFPILIFLSVSCNTSRPISEITAQETALEYSRSACFGTCPVYKVLLTKTGRVYFVGHRFVPMLDTVSFQLNDKIFRDIKAIQDLENYRHLEPDSSNVEVADVPVLNFTDIKNDINLELKMNIPGEIEAITDRIDRQLTAQGFLPGKGENALGRQEIILELEPGSDPYNFNNTFHFYELNYLKKISDHIFLYRLVTTKNLVPDAISDLNSKKGIIAAQKNHELEHR